MRDFESDVIHAALAGEPIPASEFSWSPMRHYLFMTCRRAYFIRYYLAQGGWNVHSHPLAKSAYLEKHLPPYRLWLARTVQSCTEKSLLEALREPDAVLRRRLFRDDLLKNMRSAVSSLFVSLEEEAYLTDPKLPGFLEYLREEKGFRDLDHLAGRIIRTFACAAGGLEKFFVPVLERLDHTGLRVDEPFLMLPMHSFPVWTAAGIIYTDGDTLCSLHFEYSGQSGMETVSPELAEELRKIGYGIFRNYARIHVPDRKTLYTILRFSEDGSECVTEAEPYDVQDIVDGSSAAMLALIGEDGRVCISDFPRTEDAPESCRNCIFRMTCADLVQFSKKNGAPEQKNGTSCG